MRASFPESLHPRQQRRQLLLRQHCSDKLIAGEDHRLSVDDRRTFVRIGRQLPDDLEGVLVDPELEFARDGAPERRPLLQGEVSNLQFVICVAHVLAVSTHLETPDVVVQHRILRRSLRRHDARRSLGIARQATQREASVDGDDVGVCAEEVKIRRTSSGEILRAGIVVRDARFVDELIERRRCGCSSEFENTPRDSSNEALDARLTDGVVRHGVSERNAELAEQMRRD